MRDPKSGRANSLGKAHRPNPIATHGAAISPVGAMSALIPGGSPSTTRSPHSTFNFLPPISPTTRQTMPAIASTNASALGAPVSGPVGRTWSDSHSAVKGSSGKLLCSDTGEIWLSEGANNGKKNLSATLKAPLCRRGEPCAAIVKQRLLLFYCDMDGDLHHLLQGPPGSSIDKWQHHYVKHFAAKVVACRDGQLLLQHDGKAKSAELYYITNKRAVMRIELSDTRPARWSSILNLHQECSGCPMPALRLRHFTKKGICYEGTDRADHSLEKGFFNNWSWVIGGLRSTEGADSE